MNNSKDQNKPKIAILPQSEIVFPYCSQTLFVGRKEMITALYEAKEKGLTVAFAYEKDALADSDTDSLRDVATLCRIIALFSRPEGTIKVLIRGIKRVTFSEPIPDKDSVLRAECFDFKTILPPESEPIEESETYALYQEALQKYMLIDNRIREKLHDLLEHVHIESQIDILVSYFVQENEKKYTFLATQELLERVKLLTEAINEKLSSIDEERSSRNMDGGTIAAKLSELKERVKSRGLSNNINNLNNINEDLDDEIYLFKKKLNEATHIPEYVRNKIGSEIKKLEMMTPFNAESAVSRSYIETIFDLPWETYTDENLNINAAEKVLDADHYGLTKPKQRILEHLAVQALTGSANGSILCLLGPPGVGKTSLGRSIACSINRNFARVSLGGVNDQSEIRGHRRTYVGAMPGKIISAIKRARSSNPVLLLDEIDKVSSENRGDPSAALLEVLDPQQNNTFVDHYLDLEYDLSRVMFICTANYIGSIPEPLQDRLEIIEIPGYTFSEKEVIARQYLIPKQKKANGIEGVDLKFTDDALQLLANNYTREAGVRKLELEIGSICRKIAYKYVREQTPEDVESTEPKVEKPNKKRKDKTDVVDQGEVAKNADSHDQKGDSKTGDEKKSLKIDWPDTIDVDSELLLELLGQPIFKEKEIDGFNQIGITNGLAWTSAGGVILVAEALTMPGRGELIITGKLGEVMQESARAAMSYVRSRSDVLNLPEDFYKKIDVHIHFPEGATPKDGPSAGITMTVSLVSALTRIPVRHDVAMTGEVTLRGRVLAIGGLKEKLMAAYRAGIRKVLIPKDNTRDIDDVPAEIRNSLEIVPVDHIDEVLKHALYVKGNDELPLIKTSSCPLDRQMTQCVQKDDAPIEAPTAEEESPSELETDTGESEESHVEEAETDLEDEDSEDIDQSSFRFDGF